MGEFEFVGDLDLAVQPVEVPSVFSAVQEAPKSDGVKSEIIILGGGVSEAAKQAATVTSTLGVEGLSLQEKKELRKIRFTGGVEGVANTIEAF